MDKNFETVANVRENYTLKTPIIHVLKSNFGITLIALAISRKCVRPN